MRTKEMIQLNNEKRKRLNEENLKLYEDMLVYVRLNTRKDEQQTEEVLLEILDHLLIAQAENKPAAMVFGDDPKAFCQELLDEIPSESKKTTGFFIAYIVLQFLAIISLVHGLLGFALHYFFQLGTAAYKINIGSGSIRILINLLLLYIIIHLILKWIKSSTFKENKRSNTVSFLYTWIICSLCIGAWIAIPLILPIPDFGASFHIPLLSFAVIGALLYLVSMILNKKLHILP